MEQDLVRSKECRSAGTSGWLLAVVVGVLLFPITWTSLMLPRPVWDEALVHLATARRFGPGLPALELLRSYPSAVGPFFYLLFGNLGALFHYHIIGLRLLVFLFAALNCWLFQWLLAHDSADRSERCRSAGTTQNIGAVLVLVTFPYFLTLSGLFLSEQPALSFALAALLVYLKGRSWSIVLCLVLTALALLTRQHFLFLPVVLAANELLTPDGGRAVRRALLLLTPIVVVVPLVIIWQGLVPPPLQWRHRPEFGIANLSSVLLWIGFYFWPWLVQALTEERGRNRWWWSGLALVAVPIALAAPVPGAGIVRTLLGLLPGPAGTVGAVILAVLGAAELITTSTSLRSQTPRARVAVLSVLCLLVVLSCAGPTLFERHFLTLYPFLLLAAGPLVRPRPALLWSILFQLPLAVVQIVRLAGK